MRDKQTHHLLYFIIPRVTVRSIVDHVPLSLSCLLRRPAQTYQDSVRWLAHVEQSMVPPSLAGAAVDTSPRVAERRDSVAAVNASSSDSNNSSRRTSVGSVDVNLKTLSI